jgi:hypothetical protein
MHNYQVIELNHTGMNGISNCSFSIRILMITANPVSAIIFGLIKCFICRTEKIADVVSMQGIVTDANGDGYLRIKKICFPG